MPWGVLMLTAHYLCHRDSQGWTLSTLSQEQSLKQNTVMSNLTGAQWAPLETQPGPHCLHEPMLPTVLLGVLGESRVNWQHSPRFLVWGVRKQWWHAFPFRALEKTHAHTTHTHDTCWSFHSVSQRSYSQVQAEKLRIGCMFLEVLMALGFPDLGSWATRL